MSVFDEAAFQRQQLGQALRDLRQRTGLSGLRFANRVGLAQSKVSRVELGQQVPSTADLDRWLDATGAPDDRRAELDRLREAAATEALAWRRQRARGLPALQLDVAAVEASARVLRYWHPTLVPGLLQTPAYARAVYEAMHGPDQPDLAATVAQRMDRQALLYEEGRRFEFIIGEAALRWRFGSRDVMLGQLDRIGVVTGLPNVTTGILPLDAELPVWRTHHFTVYDEREEGPLVHVELLVEGRNYRDPDDVARFQAAFQQLHKVAITGRQTHRLLAQIADTLRTSGTAARGA